MGSRDSHRNLVSSASRAFSEELPEITPSRLPHSSSLAADIAPPISSAVPTSVYGHPRYDPSRKAHVQQLTADYARRGWSREAALRNLADLLDSPESVRPAYPYWVIARAAVLSSSSDSVELSDVVEAVVTKYPYYKKHNDIAASIRAALMNRACIRLRKRNGKSYFSFDEDIDPGLGKKDARRKTAHAMDLQKVSAREFLSSLALPHAPRSPSEMTLKELPDYPSNIMPLIKPYVLIRSAILASPAQVLAEPDIVASILNKYPQLQKLSSKPVWPTIQKSLHKHNCFCQVKIDGDALSCWIIDHAVDPRLRRSFQSDLTANSPRKRKRSDAQPQASMTIADMEAELSKQVLYYTAKDTRYTSRKAWFASRLPPVKATSTATHDTISAPKQAQYCADLSSAKTLLPLDAASPTRTEATDDDRQTVMPFSRMMSEPKAPLKNLMPAAKLVSDTIITDLIAANSPVSRKAEGFLPSFTNFIKLAEQVRERHVLSPESMDDNTRPQASAVKVPPKSRPAGNGYRVTIDNVILIDDGSSEDEVIHAAASFVNSPTHLQGRQDYITDSAPSSNDQAALPKRFVCGFADPRLPTICKVRFVTQEDRAVHTRYTHGVVAEPFMTNSPMRLSRFGPIPAQMHNKIQNRKSKGTVRQSFKSTASVTPRHFSEEL